VEKGEAVRLSGLREIYFGQYFRGDAHVSRFVESFVETDLTSNVTNLWLVFRNEGVCARANVCVCVRARTNVCVCVRARANVCVCVCARAMSPTYG